jgi:hypothetical protein
MISRLLVISALALAFAAAATAGPAKLSVVSTHGFTVQGTTFKPGEHVVVRLTTGGESVSKRLAAGTKGGFVVRFPTMFVARCASYVVSATGDMGSRAGLRIMPECAEPVTP